MPQAMPLIDVVMQEASKYNRIYIASIHHDITDNDLQRCA
jgi:poly(U)-binding-splicing factor PUF60